MNRGGFSKLAHPCQHRASLLAALSGGLLLAGCDSLSAIDRRIDREVLRQSDILGADVASPRVRPLSREDESSPGQNAKQPPSQNPDAADLSFTGADATRDVLQRLDSYEIDPTGAARMGLPEVFEAGQTSARDYLNAEEEYLLSAIRLLIEKHRWSPRFFDEVSANIDALSEDSSYRTALNIINELRATQRLPYGGEVEARLVTRAAQQLTEIAGDQYTQSSELILSANVPLLRNAGLIAQEDLIQAERDVVYAARDFETFRRQFLVDLATDYFSLVAQLAVIGNQERRLESLEKFYEQTRALVEAGRERPFQARNVEQNVLTSRDSLISSRENYILDLDRFKVRLGIPVERAVVIEPMSLDIPDPDIGVTAASEAALAYRLELQNEKDRIDDARRGVANARNQILPDLNATASAALNTDPDSRTSGLSFDGPQTDYMAGVTFGLPLDREIERLQLRQSMIQLQQRQRTYDQARDVVILEARQSVREIDRARFSLRLQEQAVKINELRLEEIEIKRDEIDAQTRLDAENELLQSRNDRDAAVRDLRIAILQYLLRTGQLRVGPDGGVKPLPGMYITLQKIETATDEASGQSNAQEAQPPAGDPDNAAPPPPPDAQDQPPPEVTDP